MFDLEEFKKCNQQAFVEQVGNKARVVMDEATTIVANQLIQYLNLQGRVLELGCNVGFLSNILHKHFPTAEIISIDHNRTCIKYARLLFPDLCFLRATSKDVLSHNIGKLDIIIACRVPFTYEDTRRLLDGILQKRQEDNIDKQLKVYILLPYDNKLYNTLEQVYVRSLEEITNIFQKLKKDYNVNILDDNLCEVVF